MREGEAYPGGHPSQRRFGSASRPVCVRRSRPVYGVGRRSPAGASGRRPSICRASCARTRREIHPAGHRDTELWRPAPVATLPTRGARAPPVSPRTLARPTSSMPRISTSILSVGTCRRGAVSRPWRRRETLACRRPIPPPARIQHDDPKPTAIHKKGRGTETVPRTLRVFGSPIPVRELERGTHRSHEPVGSARPVRACARRPAASARASGETPASTSPRRRRRSVAVGVERLADANRLVPAVGARDRIGLDRKRHVLVHARVRLAPHPPPIASVARQLGDGRRPAWSAVELPAAHVVRAGRHARVDPLGDQALATKCPISVSTRAKSPARTPTRSASDGCSHSGLAWAISFSHFAFALRVWMCTGSRNVEIRHMRSGPSSLRVHVAPLVPRNRRLGPSPLRQRARPELEPPRRGSEACPVGRTLVGEEGRLVPGGGERDVQSDALGVRRGRRRRRARSSGGSASGRGSRPRRASGGGRWGATRPLRSTCWFRTMRCRDMAGPLCRAEAGGRDQRSGSGDAYGEAGSRERRAARPRLARRTGRRHALRVSIALVCVNGAVSRRSQRYPPVAETGGGV